MAKLSMGLFLLRVVQTRWHKIALWGAVIVTTTTSIALTIMLWNQSTPIKMSWDPLRTPGVWNIQIQPLSVGLGGNSASFCRLAEFKSNKTRLLTLRYSMVQRLRFLLRYFPLVIYPITSHVSARKAYAGWRDESWSDVSQLDGAPFRRRGFIKVQSTDLYSKCWSLRNH